MGAWCHTAGTFGFYCVYRDYDVHGDAGEATAYEKMAGKLLRQASQGKGLVSADLMGRFCGSVVFLTLAFALACFYSRSLYKCLRQGNRESRGAGCVRVRLSKVDKTDLKF